MIGFLSVFSRDLVLQTQRLNLPEALTQGVIPWCKTLLFPRQWSR